MKTTTNTGEMFSAIAQTYDPLNHLLSLGIDRAWRRAVVDEVIMQLVDETIRRLDDGANATQISALLSPQILDVATGTGDLAIALARRLPEARIVGVDISEGMLEVGRRKVAKFLKTRSRRRRNEHARISAPPAPLQGAQNEFQRNSAEDRIVLQSGDAQKLPFPDATFDAVTVAFGVRNFEDKSLGLSEMRRVLKPGGRCVVLEFSEPRGTLFSPVYRFYFHRVLPLVGRLVSRSAGAYTYLPRSVDAFPPPDEFAGMALRAGFSKVGVDKMTFGIVFIYTCVKNEN